MPQVLQIEKEAKSMLEESKEDSISSDTSNEYADVKFDIVQLEDLRSRLSFPKERPELLNQQRQQEQLLTRLDHQRVQTLGNQKNWKKAK